MKYLVSVIASMVMAFAITISASPLQAATLITDGNTYAIDSDQLFFGGETSTGGAGSFEVRFDSSTDPLTGTATAAITGGNLGLFQNLKIEWISVATNLILATQNVTAAGLTSLVTTFSSPSNLSQFLRFSYTGSTAGANFNIDVVSAIPLPPALLLLLSGIIGVGALSRRNRRKVDAV